MSDIRSRCNITKRAMFGLAAMPFVPLTPAVRATNGVEYADAQRLYNYHMSKMVEVMALTEKPRRIGWGE